MPRCYRHPLFHSRIPGAAILAASIATIAIAPPLHAVQAKPVAPAAAAAAPAPSDREVMATQEELIKLLRLSPTLTTVVEHDPSLLSNQEYVARNNPQLGQFLTLHPEVARNPEFFLFTHLHGDGDRDQQLERAVWPEYNHPYQPPSPSQEIAGNLVPFLVFVGILLGLLWLVRQFFENRRWNRIFMLQNEVHSKLIEKFGSNQELLTYMGTEAGKRFLEAAPIPIGFEAEQRVPNAVSKVLTPLQIGVVLTLLGIGLLAIRNHLGRDMESQMLLLGTVVLMPGIGFIVSALITWTLASRLGLMGELGPGHGSWSGGGPGAGMGFGSGPGSGPGTGSGTGAGMSRYSGPTNPPAGSPYDAREPR